MRRTGALAIALVAACSRGSPATSGSVDAQADVALPGDQPASFDATAILRAEDLRRAQDVPPESLRNHDPAVRRLAARALARIAATDADVDDAPLLRALEDGDEATIAWAAYGLGEACKGLEESHVRALASRLASIDSMEAAHTPLDARAAVLRALGRCGGDAAEQTLRARLRRGGPHAELAAFALGDIAVKRGSLSLESAGALLDRAQQPPCVDAALYPFGRVDLTFDDLQPRLFAAAKFALVRAGPVRIFAVRALGRSAAVDASAELGRVLSSGDFTPAERAEAARALGRQRKAGLAALGDALASIVPDRAEALAGDAFGPLLVAVGALGDEAPPKKIEASLWALTKIEPPPGAPPAIARRASQLRCAAAEKLARGAYDSDVLRSCDVADGEAGERARLAALDRGTLTRVRRAAWAQLAKSKFVRVRESALEIVSRHPEIGDAALAVIADALAAAEPGLVATAADAVHAHPDRVQVLAESERRAALDPRAPPPTANPKREIDARVAKALRAAIARTWSEDLVEVRVALVDAAIAVSLDEGRASALAACKDANATVRSRAAKALAAAGEKDARCPAPDKPAAAAAEVGHSLDAPVRVALDTDAGALAIRFDPSLAPVAATRFVALARSGYYTGIAVHRVVPGFVAQFGDRGGDGFGGSGALLRCETSPVPFGRLDVGVALAGRDTGSSQIFVVLGRAPHLEGEYAWVGNAQGDWDAVAEGDVIRSVTIEE